jgi:4-hydroxy 2-oxovalerate aldolase
MTDRRRDVTVIDCTIRDGGCTNAWKFDADLVRRTFEALLVSGVDVMEIGYHTADDVFAKGEVGPWRYCRVDDLRQVAHESAMKLAAMVDVGRIGADDLPPADDSLIDIIRIATYGQDIDQAIRLAEHAIKLGYEVYCNVMAVTTNTPQEVDRFLEALRTSPIDHVVVVDSFGAMYPHHLRYLIRKYKNWLRPDQRVGVHLHNNQQTAFANTIAAIDEGANFVDATIYGMGRGAGNCPLELLLMYLDDPRHDVRPILGLIDDYEVLRRELRWGYHVPYGITGWLNRHPSSAIERLKRDAYGCLDFYEQLTTDRPAARHHHAKQEP